MAADPQDSKPTFFAQLRSELRKNVVSKTAAAVTALVLLLASALYAGLIRGPANRFLASRGNLADTTALALARMNLGPGAARALPFRLRGQGVQYIAVAMNPESPSRMRLEPAPALAMAADSDIAIPRDNLYEVVLMKGTGGVFTAQRTGLYAFDNLAGFVAARGSDPPAQALPQFFGLVDLDGDGDQEVFAGVRMHGASSNYALEVSVYDPRSNHVYGVFLEADGNTPDPDLTTFSTDVDEKMGLRRWLSRTALALAPENDPAVLAAIDARDPGGSGERALFAAAEERWLRRYGAGYSSGPVAADPVPGDPRAGTEQSFVCEVAVGDSTWISEFKGPVWLHDRRRASSSLIYLPPTQYEWIQSMVVGERFVWLGNGAIAADGPERAPALIAYDTRERRLARVPVGGLVLDAERCGTGCLLPEPLRVRGTQLYSGELPLRLPATIDPASEFRAPAVCALD